VAFCLAQAHFLSSQHIIKKLSAMLPTFIQKSILEFLNKTNPSIKAHIRASHSVSGGSINKAVKLDTSHGHFFVKHNTAHRFPAMFDKEALGLALLAKARVIDVPQVLLTDEDEEHAFLLLSYIDSSHEATDFWDDFGERLAALHQQKAEKFGLDHDNYMGSLYQHNSLHDDWTEFFVMERLEPQIKMAREEGNLGRNDVSAFERLYKQLDSIFPETEPSLIHGDLWSGNLMANKQGYACLIDPAVYYGHPEIDIAMSTLFGGFSNRFYEAYNRHNPLEKGWHERLPIYNLYPLLVHVNLFGGSYLSSVQQTLQRF
jgi:fructosamine-3-kinase